MRGEYSIDFGSLWALDRRVSTAKGSGLAVRVHN